MRAPCFVLRRVLLRRVRRYCLDDFSAETNVSVKRRTKSRYDVVDNAVCVVRCRRRKAIFSNDNIHLYTVDAAHWTRLSGPERPTNEKDMCLHIGGHRFLCTFVNRCFRNAFSVGFSTSYRVNPQTRVQRYKVISKQRLRFNRSRPTGVVRLDRTNFSFASC